MSNKKTAYSFGTQVVNNNFVEMEETYISSGASASAVVDLGAQTLVGVVLCSTMNATSFGFLASDTASGGYYPVKNASDGTDWMGTITTLPGRYMIAPGDLAGIGRYVILVPGTPSVPVVEDGERRVRFAKKSV